MVTLLKRKGNSCQLSMKGQHLTSGLMHSKNLHCVTKIVKSRYLIIFFLHSGRPNILPIRLKWSSSILREYMNNISNQTSYLFPSYDNAKAYTYYTYISKVLDGTPHPNNMTKVKLKVLQNERTSNKTFERFLRI